MKLQRCPKCQRELPESAYSPSRWGKRGQWCRDCYRENQQEYRRTLVCFKKQGVEIRERRGLEIRERSPIRVLNRHIAHVLRSRLNMALKRSFKSGSAVRDLGCTIPEFKTCIAGKFKPGMSWENHGTVWHLDHIHPLSAFDLTNR